MKFDSKFLTLLAAALIFSLSSFISPQQNKWEKLGERKVNLGLDHDRIVIGAGDGIFSKLKIKVRNSVSTFTEW